MEFYLICLIFIPYKFALDDKKKRRKKIKKSQKVYQNKL